MSRTPHDGAALRSYERVAVVLRTASSFATRGAIDARLDLLENKRARESHYGRALREIYIEAPGLKRRGAGGGVRAL